MTKRIVSLLLAAVIAAMLVPSFAGAEWIMYVYTDDGKTLNVRSDPSVGNNLLGRLNYGSAVSVRMTSANGWACIDYNAPANGNVAYVQTRFLVSTKPTPKPVTPSVDPVVADAAKVLNEAKVPTTERFGVWNPAANAAFQQLPALVVDAQMLRCSSLPASSSGSVGACRRISTMQ